MLKTRKVISLLLVAAMIAAMFVVGVVVGNAEGDGQQQTNDCRYYLIGSFSNWAIDADYQMTTVEQDVECVIEGVALTTSDQIKAAQKAKTEDSPAAWFPDGMDNNLSVPEDGIYTVTLRVAGDGTEEDGYSYSWYAGETGYEKGGGTEHWGYLLKFEKTGEYVAPTGEVTEEPTGEEGSQEAVDTITINVVNEAGWDSVNVYYWPDGGDWPGFELEEDSVEIPAGTQGLVFNTNGGSTQTVDVTTGIEDGATIKILADLDGNKHLVDVTAPESEEGTNEPTGEGTEEPTGEGTEEPTGEAAEGEDATVTIDGVPVNAHVGDIIHYDYYLNMAGLPTAAGGKVGMVTEIQGEVHYDKAKLTLTTDIEGQSEEIIPGVYITRFASMPNLVGGYPVNSNDSDYYGFNATNASGYNFSEEKVLVHLDFEVIAAGETEIVTSLLSLASGDVKLINGGVVSEAPATRTAVDVECNHTEPTGEGTEEPTGEGTEEPTGEGTEEPTGEGTEEPTGEGTEQPTGEPVSGKSTVTVIDWSGATETKVVEVGDEITVTSYLKVPEGKKVNSINFFQYFDYANADCTELTNPAMLQLLSDVDEDEDDMFPNLGGLTANVDGNIIKGNHTAAKYKQSFVFDSDDSILIQAKYKVVGEGNTIIKTEIITLATIDDTQAMSNQISEGEKIGDDEIVTSTTLDAPEHEDGTEEPTGEGTEEPTGEGTEEPTGEGTEEPTGEGTEEPTGEGTEEPTTAPFDGILVIADGTPYEVENGEIFNYEYYMSVTEKVHSLEGQTVYMTDGLELQSDIDDEESWPVIGDDILANEEPAGTILFNYSSAKKGKDFTSGGILVKLSFKVTAESGVYTIDTTLLNVAGPDEHLFIYDGEEVDEGVETDTKMTDEAGVEKDEYTGDVPSGTEEPTGEGTEEPTGEGTEEPTGEGTEEPTGEGTEEPTVPDPSSHVDDSTNDEPGNPDSPKTGSTEIALIFLMVLVLSAGVVVFVKKRRFE